MPMKIIPLSGTILERHREDVARAEAERVKAVQEYNIMMGLLEDPAEENEEDENDE